MDLSFNIGSEWVIAIGSGLVVAAIIGAITWARNAVARSPPNMSGVWRAHVVTEETGYGKFENMELEYIVTILSDNFIFTGRGEKDRERSVGMVNRCEGVDRVRIEADGKVLSSTRQTAEIEISIQEHGLQRLSIAHHRLKLDRQKHRMRGTFFSSAGNQHGRSTWTREESYT